LFYVDLTWPLYVEGASTRKKKKEEKGKQRLRDKKAKGRPQWSVDKIKSNKTD
jgi:hypothetical protein